MSTNHRFRPLPYLVLAVLSILSLTGCSVLQGFSQLQAPPPTALPAAAQPPTVPPPAAPTQAPLPTDPPQPTFTALPTYTPLPTDTPLPTYTAIPTGTPFPTFTALPLIYTAAPVYSIPVQAGSTCCTLRVRNQNLKLTYWIGTVRPYGGNYIKPLHYVEFYPHQPTWMRIWWCRYTWNKNSLYNCSCKDVYVDEPFMEIGVR